MKSPEVRSTQAKFHYAGCFTTQGCGLPPEVSSLVKISHRGGMEYGNEPDESESYLVHLAHYRRISSSHRTERLLLLEFHLRRISRSTNTRQCSFRPEAVPNATFYAFGHHAFIRSPLIDKIHAKSVQNQTSKHEIRKRPLTADPAWILLNTLSWLRHALCLLARCRWCSFTRLHA